VASKHWLVGVVFGLVVSCGGGGDDGGNPTAPDATAMLAGCPLTPPVDDSPCQPSSFCTYGDDPRIPNCRLIAGCEYDPDRPGYDPTNPRAYWATLPRSCAPVSTAGCPTTSDLATGTCTAQGSICRYDDGVICGCDSTWACADAPAAGCPSVSPNVGQPCAPEGLMCEYGSCELPAEIQVNKTHHVCTDGVWANYDIALCPP
jgi:hypothetical protein